MTTILELARLIAHNARAAPDTADAPAQAVIQTLFETSTWIYRVIQDADGVIEGDAPPDPLPEK